MSSQADTLPPPPPEPPEGASAAYVRVFEELGQFVSPQLVRELLDEGLDQVGVGAEDAIPYDFRALLVDFLPARLETFLPGELTTAVVAVLEEVLVDMHSPPQLDAAEWSDATPSP